MKTHKNPILKKELLIVELPYGVKIFHDEDDEGNHIGYSLTKFEKDSVQSFGLVEGYTLLGLPDDIKNDDVRELVESWESVAKYYQAEKNTYDSNRTLIFVKN